MLTIDEADRILEVGFEEEMHQIVKLLPTGNQGVFLFCGFVMFYGFGLVYGFGLFCGKPRLHSNVS